MTPDDVIKNIQAMRVRSLVAISMDSTGNPRLDISQMPMSDLLLLQKLLEVTIMDQVRQKLAAPN